MFKSMEASKIETLLFVIAGHDNNDASHGNSRLPRLAEVTEMTFFY